MRTIVIASWEVKEEYLESVLFQTHELKKYTLQEKGIVSYQVFQSHKEPNKITLIEEYASLEAVQEHLESDHYKKIAIAKIHPFLSVRTGDVQVKL